MALIEPSGADDFRRADDDAGAGAGQADFRQAEGEDRHVVVPERRGVGEDDAGKRRAVGIVDDQRDAVLFREGGQAGDLVVGEDVAGRIGRARGADRGDVRGDFEVVEIDAVFELVRPGFFDQRGDARGTGRRRRPGSRSRCIPAPAAAGFSCGVPSGISSGEQVEEEEERGLAAAGDGDVFRADIPAEGLAEKRGDGLDEMRISARRIVGGERRARARRFPPAVLRAAGARRRSSPECAPVGRRRAFSGPARRWPGRGRDRPSAPRCRCRRRGDGRNSENSYDMAAMPLFYSPGLTTNNPQTTMSIKVGDKAPDFTLVTKTAEGPQLVKLSDLIGKSNIVLLFVPMAFTGVCTTEFCDISARHLRLRGARRQGARHFRRQSVRASRMGREGRHHPPAAQRLRARGRQGLRRGLRAIPARRRT